MNLLFAFLAGMFVTNAVPHVVSGVTGNRHMTPLAKESSALVNVVWGFVNLLLGLWLFQLSGATVEELVSLDTVSLTFWLGSFLLGLTAAWLFSNPNARFPWFK